MKAIFSLALICGALTFTNAQAFTVDTLSVNQEEVLMVQTPDEWKEVKMEDLNDKVQAAIKAYEGSYEIKAITLNETSNQTKVVLVSKSDSTEKTIILNEEGEEVKDQVEE